MPRRGTVFQDGDLLYAAVADARLAKVEAILGRRRDAMNATELAKGA